MEGYTSAWALSKNEAPFRGYRKLWLLDKAHPGYDCLSPNGGYKLTSNKLNILIKYVYNFCAASIGLLFLMLTMLSS
jgi:hypothetical protein